jgi:hypothetical protein
MSDPEESGHVDEAHGDPWWLDRPQSINLLIKILLGISAATVLADFFYHKHADYGFQGLFGFDAVYGFVACVGLVLAAKVLRKLLMRSEDYYD